MLLRARVLGIAAVIVLQGCATSVPTAPEISVALSGSREVPPNASTAAGVASFWVHTDRTLNGIAETSGMDATAANLYLGGPEESGPLVLYLVRAGSDGPFATENAPISGASWSIPRSARLSEEEYRAYLAGRIYLNVHSARYPEGEIRGQLRP
jgi:hypothetical protein